MKLNISNPATGAQKLIDIEDEKKLRTFIDKRISQEVDAGCLGNEWKGYVVRISGGNDKQGFPMKQGILTNNRVRLLMARGMSCYRERRSGERRRKSVKGCIVDSNLSVLSLVIVKKGEQEIDGLTNRVVPRVRGPKRANKIRKLFNLGKDDDVRKYVVRKPLKLKEGKTKQKFKAPKIQRLITPQRLQRKRKIMQLKKKRVEKQRVQSAEYAKLLVQYLKEKRERKRSESKRRSSTSRSSLSDKK